MASESASEITQMLKLLGDTEARVKLDRFVLLKALGDALENAGHLRLVQATAETAESSRFGGLIALLLFWGLGASAGVAIGASPIIWIVLGVGMLLAYGILASESPTIAQSLAPVVMVGWVAAGVALATSDPDGFFWTHGIPILLVLIATTAMRNLRLREARDAALALAGVVRSAPYVAPVVLVVVLLPALTADVWRLAAATDAGNLVAAAVLSVGLLSVLVTRQLRREFESALASRCRSLATRAATPEATRKALIAASDEETGPAIRELPDRVLSSTWPQAADEYAPYLAAAEGDMLRKPLGTRLLITALGVGLMLATYIYALLAVTVPTDVAASWSDSTIPTHDLELLGITATIPGGSYVAIAVLLGIFATAIFLAFAVTEERVATAFTEALLREPIDHFLLLAVPFTTLIEWWLENQGDYESDDVEEESDGPDSSSESGAGDISS